jgi:hypothetical protein
MVDLFALNASGSAMIILGAVCGGLLMYAIIKGSLR